jgi:hypothetical protein
MLAFSLAKTDVVIQSVGDSAVDHRLGHTRIATEIKAFLEQE